MANAITYITQLNINGSAAYQFHVAGTSYFNGIVKIGAYSLPTADGSAGQVLCTDGSGTVSWGAGGGGGAGWADAADPYIIPCNGCGIMLNGDIYDCTSTHHLGVASSPGAFADVNAACGSFTTCVITPKICTGGDLDLYSQGNHTASFGSSFACFGTVRTKDIYAFSNGSCGVGMSNCRFGTGYINCFYACRKMVLPVGTNCY